MSIRQHGYLHEHMFPFRSSRAANALLELAEALLAPLPLSSEPADEADRQTDTSSEPCAIPHPHRRTVAIERRRRPAAPVRLQPCVTPLTRAARAAAASPAPARAGTAR